MTVHCLIRISELYNGLIFRFYHNFCRSSYRPSCRYEIKTKCGHNLNELFAFLIADDITTCLCSTPVFISYCIFRRVKYCEIHLLHSSNMKSLSKHIESTLSIRMFHTFSMKYFSMTAVTKYSSTINQIARSMKSSLYRLQN